jgi:hypothetical protein
MQTMNRTLDTPGRPRAARGAARLGCTAVTLMVISGLLAVHAVTASAQAAPPPGYVAGTGQLEGTERLEENQWLGLPCVTIFRTVFALRGVGSYWGQRPAGEEVVYRAEIGSGQTLYGNGPLQVEVDSKQAYYNGPDGTHGTSDASCTAATTGDPVPAEFGIYAAEQALDTDADGRVDLLGGQAWVYRLDAENRKVPCLGDGSFYRLDQAADPNWFAQWALRHDCTVIGNGTGTPGTGVVPAGSGHTHTGTHSPCFTAPCNDNFHVDSKQYLPFKGLHVGMNGPSSAQVASPVTLTAVVTNDGQPLANTPVSFSVAGPSAAAPPTGAAPTGSDGRATFTFTAANPGDYTVTATASTATGSKLGTHTVRFTPPPPPAVTLQGPSTGQTEEGNTLVATVTNGGNPVPGAQVSFAVNGPGTTTPTTGSSLSDGSGKASFTFSADRAGDYGVTASSTVVGQPVSASHTVRLAINTLRWTSSLTLPSNEDLLRAAVIAPDGRYAYFGTQESGVVKVDLATFTRVGALALEPGESDLRSAVIDPAGRYAYFGTGTAPARVVKIDLADFTRAAAVTLPSGENDLRAAVIDPAGAYAYFGSANATPGKVVKIDLATFTRAGVLTFPAGEQGMYSAVMDPAGRYGYFAAWGEGQTQGRLVKVDLSTFGRVGSVSFEAAEREPMSAVIDPGGRYAYVGTRRSPGQIVKIDLDAFVRVGAITLTGTGENKLATAVIDPGGGYAYFGAAGDGLPKVVKVDLSTFQRVHGISLPAGNEGSLESAVIDPNGNSVYFGKVARGGAADWVPPKLVKVAVSRPPVPWLLAGNDSYTTPFATALSVPAPGVLVNDDDTQDADALGATLVGKPAHGSVTLNRNGSFSYTAESGYSGADTFTYKVDDGVNFSAPATVSITVGAAPQGVQAVSGGAFGFETNVSLFGGPATVKGGAGSTCGQAGQPACADGQSPAVNLPPSGGDVAAADPDGNVGQYGPAFIFESHGALTVRTQGATGPAGAVVSSASVKDIADNDPFHAGGPDGEAASTCTATRTTLGGSARIVNGRLVTSTNPSTGEPATEITFPHDWAPAPNTEYRGTLNHVGDSWRIVFNEQVLSPEAITVNAVHMYLLGPTAVGDMVIGQSRCGVVTSAANTAPVGNDDAYTATAGRPLVVPAAGVLANDTDADGQALTAAKPAGTRPPASGGGTWTFPGEPAHGTLDLRGDGSFTYTPAPGYSGPDSFTYLAQDARGKSDPATVALTVAPANRRAVADFDGNGSSDVSVFRPSDGGWYAQGSAALGYGAPGDIAVSADYDGDGRTDVAVFRPSNGVWYIHGSAGVDLALAYGASGDIPVPADYDGDAKADIAVFRSGVWYIHNSAGGDTALGHGTNGDIPVPADYDGDAKADIAVFRPSQGAWYIRNSAGGADTAVGYGADGDIPVAADYNGDGRADIAVFRPSEGVWYVQGGSATAWGANGDVPVPGDYDGDAKADIAVFRPSQGVWYLHNSGGGDTAVGYGANGDVPAPLAPAISMRFF